MEMMSFRCESCGGEFASLDGMDSHKRDKHQSQSSQSKSKNHQSQKKLITIILLIAAALFIASGYSFYKKSVDKSIAVCLSTPAEEMDIGGHNKVRLHIHPILEITVLGKHVPLPANVGIGNFMRPIHTHDEDASKGVLHIEAPCIRDFQLIDFFEIWGKEYGAGCYLGFCNNETHSWNFSVNDIEGNPDTYVFKDKDKIVLMYGLSEQDIK